MHVATAARMRAIEERAYRDFGIPPLLLMENAGRATAALAWGILTGMLPSGGGGGPHPLRLWPAVVSDPPDGSHKAGHRLAPPDRLPVVAVMAGHGNNGGDAFCAARHLMGWGCRVTAELWGDPDRLSDDSRLNLRAARASGVPVQVVDRGGSSAEASQRLAAADLIIDGLLGTGVSGPPRGVVADAIAAINAAGRPVLAIDLPSGAETDTGQAEGLAVRARWTVALGLPKPAHFLFPAAGLTNEVWLAGIGIPSAALAQQEGLWEAVTPAVAAGWVPRLPADAHKGSRGRVMVVGGYRSMPGAVVLAARAALRSGAGLVYAGVPELSGDVVAAHTPEVITYRLPATPNGGFAPKALPLLLDAARQGVVVGLGPGLHTEPESQQVAREFALRSPAPVVLDADGIRAFAGQAERLREAASPVVLTPHPGEAAELLGSTARDVQANRPAALEELIRLTGQTVVLKGAFTLVGAPGRGLRFNLTGNRVLGTAGSGDVLTGMTAALLAQGLPPFDAAALGVWLHGRAGDRLAAQVGYDGVLAGELAEEVPAARRDLTHREAGRP